MGRLPRRRHRHPVLAGISVARQVTFERAFVKCRNQRTLRNELTFGVSHQRSVFIKPEQQIGAGDRQGQNTQVGQQQQYQQWWAIAFERTRHQSHAVRI